MSRGMERNLWCNHKRLHKLIVSLVVCVKQNKKCSVESLTQMSVVQLSDQCGLIPLQSFRKQVDEGMIHQGFCNRLWLLVWCQNFYSAYLEKYLVRTRIFLNPISPFCS